MKKRETTFEVVPIHQVPEARERTDGSTTILKHRPSDSISSTLRQLPPLDKVVDNRRNRKRGCR